MSGVEACPGRQARILNCNFKYYIDEKMKALSSHR